MHVIEVDGPIDRPLRAYLEERLAEAERAGAIVVLELDTPGALGQDGVVLAERVAHLEVPVLAWVGPVPAKASGAGLLLMLASSLAGRLARLADGPAPAGGRPSTRRRGPRDCGNGSTHGSRREGERSISVPLDRPLSAQRGVGRRDRRR